LAERDIFAIFTLAGLAFSDQQSAFSSEELEVRSQESQEESQALVSGAPHLSGLLFKSRGGGAKAISDVSRLKAEAKFF